MRKACLSILLLLTLVLPASARKVRGTVEGDGVRLQNVIVTDGYRFTETDKQGRFRLNTHPDARYIAVVTPGGYVADYSSGVPRFFQALEGRKRFDFSLRRTSGATDYTLFSVSDPQMQNQKHVNRFLDAPLKDLREQAAKYSAERPTVGIALGDVAWNKLGVFDQYKEAIATTGIPFYAVIGNHDFIQNKDGIAAGAAYEAAFGPYNYAFFLGDDLVIGLNNIIFKGNGTDDPEKSSNNYGEGYGKETLDFVEGLLAHVDKGTHLFIAQHSPVKYANEKGPILGGDQLLSILRWLPVSSTITRVPSAGPGGRLPGAGTVRRAATRSSPRPTASEHGPGTTSIIRRIIRWSGSRGRRRIPTPASPMSGTTARAGRSSGPRTASRRGLPN